MSRFTSLVVVLACAPLVALAGAPPDAGVPPIVDPPAAAPAPAQPSPPEGFLVAPFENRSPVRSLDWMISALATTTAEKLESVPSMRPVYGPRILDGMPPVFDEKSIGARAADKGARWIVGGSFSRPNWKAEVTVRLYEVTADETLKLVAQASRTGAREKLVELLDDDLVDVLAQHGLHPDGATLGVLRRAPTRDLYALTLYGRAMNAFYGLETRQDLAVAEKMLGRVLNIDPKFAEAHRMMGVVELDEGEPAKAAGQYAYALDLRPSYPAAMIGLAQLYRAQDRRQPAEEMAAKALELRPWDAEMRYLLGTLELEGNELDKALADLKRVVAEHPHHLGAHRALVQVYANQGDIEALASELGEVVALTPEDIDVRVDLGAALMRLGRFDRALAAFEEVLKRQPRNVEALKLSGDLYRKVGDHARAIASYEKMRHLAPDDPRGYFLLGNAYVEAGNDAKAEAVLQDAQQFTHYLGEVWIDLGAIALRRGELSKATWYLQRAVVRAPNRPKAHFDYALVLDATNHRDQALSELRTASALDPADAEIAYLTGVIYLRLGRLEEAKTAFTAALKLDPQHLDAQHNLALLDDLDRRYNSESAGTGSQ